MNITSKEEAFRILENSRIGIPFHAIKYLIEYGKDEEILNKVVYHIDNAYKESLFYNYEQDYFSNAPLWYCIVAEGHIDEKLIDPIIKLYTATQGNWDFLNEQGNYILGKLCMQFGHIVIDKCIKKCIELNKIDSNLPYLFLFESLYFAEAGRYDNEILELLKNPTARWIESLICQLGNSKYKKILPRLKELQEYYEKIENESIITRHTLIEIKEAIKGIENTHEMDSDNYTLTRGNWESHYKKLESKFLPDNQVKKKIGRNDPCLCGSGKKYKKCCLLSDID